MADEAAFQIQTVAGEDRTPEADLFEPGEEEELPGGLARIETMQHQQAASLRQSFNDQHAGHHRDAGEMPLKERFIETDALMRLDVFPVHDLVDPVHEQEWITVGEKLQNLADVKRGRLVHAVYSLSLNCKELGVRLAALEFFQFLFKLGQALEEFGEAGHKGQRAHVGTLIHGGRAAHDDVAGDIFGDPRLGANGDVVADVQVPGDTDLSGERAVVPDRGGTGNAHL